VSESEEFKGRCPTCGQEYLQDKLREAHDEIGRVTDIAKRRMAWLNYYKGLWNESGPDASQPPFAAKEDEL